MQQAHPLTNAIPAAGDAGGADWPDAMRRELAACVNMTDRNVWAQKWGRYLSGEVGREKAFQAKRPVLDALAWQRALSVKPSRD